VAAPQRKWLQRIGEQLAVETIVDREALGEGELRSQGGGFDRLNKQLEGKLEDFRRSPLGAVPTLHGSLAPEFPRICTGRRGGGEEEREESPRLPVQILAETS